MTGLLEAAVLAGSCLAALTWVAVVQLGPRSASLAPRSTTRRSFTARAWLYAPLWVPALLVLASFLPGLVSAAFGSMDHCHLHDLQHHHHLCVVHPPHASGGLLPWALALALLVPASAAAALGVRRALREWRLARTLVRLGRDSDLGPDIRVLEDDEPLALTVGWLRSRILLSRGLIARITPATLDVVVAHERAHVRRYDGLFGVVDRLVAGLLPRAVATPLLEELSLAREQACDDHAAAGPGGRIGVARALVEVARLGMAPPAIGVSVASSAIEARIAHLLGPAVAGRGWTLGVWAGFATLVALGAGPMHTVVEYTISHLLH